MSESIVETMALAYDNDVWGAKGGLSQTGVKAMRAALKAASDAGWKLLPKSATNEMVDAAMADDVTDLHSEYEAMWRAAPKV